MRFSIFCRTAAPALGLAAALVLSPRMSMHATAQDGRPSLRTQATPAAPTATPWRDTIVPDPGARARREMLLSHGINPEPAAMLRFLENGFDPKMMERGLPDDPALKSAVVDAVLRELGLTAAPEGLPMLQRIAARNLPPGVLAIIERDFEAFPLNARDNQVSVMGSALSMNAVVGLGLIGDRAAAPVVLDAMRRERPTGFITNGAIALGQMGLNDGIPSVVLLASDPNSADSVAAFETLYVLTGRNYGYTRNTSMARRRQLVADMRQWFEQEGRSVPVYRSEVLRRMQRPLMPADMEPGSIRSLIRGTQDLGNYDRRYAARAELRRVSKARIDEFESIISDPLEDTDIRSGAMMWLAAADPKRARTVIRRYENDENRMVAETAKSLRADIREAISYDSRSR